MLLGGVAMVTGSTTDLTRVPESAGEDVVLATISIIHESCVFENDFLFLRRLAFVLTDNGMSTVTYREGFHGGIWQVSHILGDVLTLRKIAI